MQKIILVIVLTTVTLLAGCGGTNISATSGGTCKAMSTPYVSGATECWEYSTDEKNASTHCAAAGGTNSAAACEEAGRTNSCTTSSPPSPLAGTEFKVYWYSGSTFAAIAACSALGGL